ncbi:unnamed protein product [Rotaria sp. Silwood2]|nr:unnamed protein product [Rotaria sp. Silwood2]
MNLFTCCIGALSLYGVQLNLNPVSLPYGWSQCYNGTYDVFLNTTTLTSVLNTCNKAKLLLGCRPKGNTNLTVAAMGLRADVLYNCSTYSSCTNVANGVGWYYSDNYSWGFANDNDTVARGSCDIGSTNAAYRLCWHTDQWSGGWRCGASTGLNNDNTTERVIYHAT